MYYVRCHSECYLRIRNGVRGKTHFKQGEYMGENNRPTTDPEKAKVFGGLYPEFPWDAAFSWGCPGDYFEKV